MPTPIAFDSELGRQFIKYARLVAGRGYVHNTLGNIVIRAAHPDYPHGLAYTKHAEVSLEETSVSLSGRVEQLCNPVLALDAQVFLPLRTLSQAQVLPKPASGHLWSRLTVNGRPAAPSITVEVSGSNLAYERFGPTSLTAKMHYAGERVRVSGSDGTILLVEPLRLLPEDAPAPAEG